MKKVVVAFIGSDERGMAAFSAVQARWPDLKVVQAYPESWTWDEKVNADITVIIGLSRKSQVDYICDRGGRVVNESSHVQWLSSHSDEVILKSPESRALYGAGVCEIVRRLLLNVE